MWQSYWALGQSVLCHWPDLSQDQPWQRRGCKEGAPTPLVLCPLQGLGLRRGEPYVALQKAGQERERQPLTLLFPALLSLSVLLAPPATRLQPSTRLPANTVHGSHLQFKFKLLSSAVRAFQLPVSFWGLCWISIIHVSPQHSGQGLEWSGHFALNGRMENLAPFHTQSLISLTPQSQPPAESGKSFSHLCVPCLLPAPGLCTSCLLTLNVLPQSLHPSKFFP